MHAVFGPLRLVELLPEFITPRLFKARGNCSETLQPIFPHRVAIVSAG